MRLGLDMRITSYALRRVPGGGGPDPALTRRDAALMLGRPWMPGPLPRAEIFGTDGARSHMLGLGGGLE